MKMGTIFKEKQVTVTVLAVVQCLPSQPLFQTRCFRDIIQLIKAGPSEASAYPTRP